MKLVIERTNDKVEQYGNGDLESGDRTSVGSGIVTFGIILFGIIAALIGFDIAADYRSGTERPHLLTEAVVMSLALAGLVVLLRRFWLCNNGPSS